MVVTASHQHVNAFVANYEDVGDGWKHRATFQRRYEAVSGSVRLRIFNPAYAASYKLNTHAVLEKGV